MAEAKGALRVVDEATDRERAVPVDAGSLDDDEIARPRRRLEPLDGDLPYARIIGLCAIGKSATTDDDEKGKRS
jgi:hypothetical protein